MTILINGDTMTLVIDARVLASARFSEHAAADGIGVWIVSTRSARLFISNQAVTSLTLAQYLAVDCGDNDPRDHGQRMRLTPR